MENTLNVGGSDSSLYMDEISKELKSVVIEPVKKITPPTVRTKKSSSPSPVRLLQNQIYKNFKATCGAHARLMLRLQTNKVVVPSSVAVSLDYLNTQLPMLATSRKKIVSIYSALEELVNLMKHLAELENDLYTKLGVAKSKSNSNGSLFESVGSQFSTICESLKSFIQRCGLNSLSITKFAAVTDDLSLEGIAEYILRNKPQKVIVLAGAGLSVSAGIPDFRSPGSGLYYNVAKYELPHPTSIFTLDYFKQRPEPFLEIARELYPGQFTPTIGHYFVRLLEKKQMLLRNYTQNIDCLEALSGIPAEKIVEAHGTFSKAHCLNVACKKEFSGSQMKRSVFDKEVLKCDQCQSLVKPDVIMFGEDLPNRFFNLRKADFPLCDLLIVLGTTLKVEHFKLLINEVPSTTPRLLINREMVAVLGDEKRRLGLNEGFIFDQPENYRDIFAPGDCDSTIEKLASCLGWTQELQDLMMEEKKHLQDYAQAFGF